jgi:probable phosphoglycerate mutase
MNTLECSPLLEGRGFLFIRHGQSEANVAGMIAGSLDSPLTRLGMSQALTAAARLDSLHPDRIYCSASRRAQETASLIGRKFGLVPVVVEGLAERSWGELEGTPLGERRETAREAAPSGGETWDQFSQRTMDAFRNLVGTPRTLVVAHSGTYRVLREALLGEDPDEESLHNCQVVVFNKDRGGWSASMPG